MTVILKYFYEKSDNDYKNYNEIWDKNLQRMIFLQTHLPPKKQIKHMYENISDNKDILAIRFPSKDILNNFIIKKIMSGESYNNWHPKEIWLYYA